jgi:hypothetical protein
VTACTASRGGASGGDGLLDVANAPEFAVGATNAYELAAGIGMGVILPGLVFLALRVAAVLADV